MAYKTTIALILLLACIGAGKAAAADAARAAELNYNLIDFSVQATREVANDLMQATVFTEAVGSKPEKLAAEVNKRLQAAMAQAKAVKAVKAESGNYRSWANYQKGKQEGWRTRAELRLESRDFAALTKLIGHLQATGMQLAAMEFTISAALRTRTEQELTGEALSAFQSRADMIRKSLKAKTLKIVTIHLDTQAAQPPRRLFRSKTMASRADAAPPAASAGTSSILVSAAGTVQVQ